MFRLTFFILCIVVSTAFSQSQNITQAKKLYETKKFDEATKLLKNVNDEDKDYAEARYYLGRIAFDTKEYGDAADYFEDATEKNSKVADYYNWLGNSYGSEAREANVIKQGMLAPKMRNAWEQAIKLDAKNIDARTSLIQFYLQAPAIVGGSVDKAKATAKEIMTLNVAQGHLQLGNIYVSEKKIPEAEKEFLEMVKADPALSARLLSFYVNQKQFDKAFALVEGELQKSPQDMIMSYQFGKLSAQSGMKMERGQELLKKYLSYTPKPNEPSHAGANMRLAQIEEKKGNKAEAKRLYDLALKSDQTLKEAKEGLERVK